jgi:HlyD family secretion protein
MFTKRNVLISGFILIVAIFAGWFWFDRQKSSDAETAAANSTLIQRTVKVNRQPIRVAVTATGTVQPIYKIDIKSKASGSVLSLKLSEGDFIKKGDVIATIEKTDALAAYNQTKANLDVAKATLKQVQTNIERSKQLYAEKLISAQEMDVATLQLEQSKAQLVNATASFQQAAIRFNDCIVKSPIEGIILDKPVDEGQVIMGGLNSVAGGTTIVTVADMRRVYIYANVDEVDVGKVKLGQTAQIVADAYPEEKMYGTVLRIDPLAKVEQNVTRFSVIIEAPNESYRLLAGMNATVTIIIFDKTDALVVPIEALKDGREMRELMKQTGGKPDSTQAQRRRDFRDKLAGGDTGAIRLANDREGKLDKQKRRFVFIKNEKGEYVSKPIVIGEQNYDYAEVISGLNEGDEIQYTIFSRAKLEGKQFQDRIKNSSGLGTSPQPSRREMR